MYIYELEGDKGYIDYLDLMECEKSLRGEYSALGAEDFIPAKQRAK